MAIRYQSTEASFNSVYRRSIVLFGYARSSIEEVNIENQTMALLDAGVSGPNIYSDAGVSGTTGVSTRNGWRTMRSKLKRGDVLVVAALDRIGRTALDMHGAIISLHTEGIRVRTLADSERFLNSYLDCEPDSPEAAIGNVVISVLALVSQLERDAIARRTRIGLARRRAAGKRVGPEPILNEKESLALVQDRDAGMSWPKLAKKYRLKRTTAMSTYKRVTTPKER